MTQSATTSDHKRTQRLKLTEGLPTAANSAGQSAASILRATLTTTSANCAE